MRLRIKMAKQYDLLKYARLVLKSTGEWDVERRKLRYFTSSEHWMEILIILGLLIPHGDYVHFGAGFVVSDVKYLAVWQT